MKKEILLDARSMAVLSLLLEKQLNVCKHCTKKKKGSKDCLLNVYILADEELKKF